MGLNLPGIGKKLEDILGTGVSDVGHVIGGAGQAIGNEVGQLPGQVGGIIHAAAPVANNVVNPMAPVPTAARNFVMNNIIAPPVGLVGDVAKADIGQLTNNPTAVRNANVAAGNTAVSFARGIPRGAVQLAATAAQAGRGLSNDQSTYEPDNPVAKFVLGKEPVGSLQNVYQTTPGGVAEKAVNTLGTGTMDVLGTLGGAEALTKGVRAVASDPLINNEAGSVKLPGSAEKPSVAQYKSPDVATYLDKTNKSPEFTGNLESDLQKLVGTHQANSLALEKLISDNKINPTDLEAAFHYGEDRTSPVTAVQKGIYDKYVAPIKEASLNATNSLRETPLPNDETYMHRIALDKNGRAERYLSGDVQSPAESALRKTVDASKGRTMKALVDSEGNRTVVNIDTPENKLGAKSGTKQVLAFRDGESEHLGSFRTKTQGDLMDKELSPLQKQLNNLSQQSRALDRVRQRGGDTTAQENALARKVALIRDSADAAGRELTPAENRSVRLATSKGVALKNVAEPTSNVPRIQGNLTSDIAYLKDRIQNIHDSYDPTEVNNKIFTDKTGKQYTITDATAKEVMANSKVRYMTDPVTSQAIGHVNAVNAKAANDFLANWKTSPDFADHALKADSPNIPDNWVTAKSPYFKGYYFDPKTAKLLDTYAGGSTPEPGVIGKVWNGATNIAVQAIVINPEVHGVNLLTQASIAAGNIPLDEGLKIPGGPKGVADFARSLGGLKDAASRSELLDNYLRAGGHFMSYGADHDTILTRAADSLNIPHVSKLNASVMSGIDANLRAALYDASVKGGMAPEEAVKNIDTFMGRRGNPSELVKGTTLFYHWLKTQATGLGASVRHPIANAGATTNAIAISALLYGANKAYQQFTGNPNAHVRTPGEIGLAQSLIKAPGEVQSGQVPSVVQSHVNPLLVTLADQAYGQNLRTGQKLSTPAARLKDVGDRLLTPSTMVEKVGQSKSTAAEQVLNELGLYTPHATGAPAVTKGPLQAINTPGAVAEKTGDPTGYTQQSQYFDAVRKATGGLNQTESNAFGVVHPQKKDPTTGQYTYQPTVFDSENNASTYLRFPKVLQADIQVNQQLASQGQAVDPLWKQSPDKIQAYLTYQTINKNNTQQLTDWQQKNPWYQGMEQDRSVFFNSLPPGDPNKPQAPIAPIIQTPQLQESFKQYDALTDPTQKATFLGAHPELTTYMTQAAERTNKVLVAQHLTPLKPYPTPDANTASYTAAYVKATPAQKAALKSGNPQGYTKMSAYLQNVNEYEVAKNGALDQLAGQTPNQKLLKGISSLSNYDMVKNPDGTLALKYGSVNPGATSYGSVASVPQGGAVSTGNVGSSSSQASFQRRTLRNAGKVLRIKAPKVYMPKKKINLYSAKARPAKVSVPKYATPSRPKVSLKSTH